MTHTTKPELKPCPFCGSNCVNDTSPPRAGKHGQYYWVCPDCVSVGPFADSPKEAAIKWNTHAPQPIEPKPECQIKAEQIAPNLPRNADGKIDIGSLVGQWFSDFTIKQPGINYALNVVLPGVVAIQMEAYASQWRTFEDVPHNEVIDLWHKTGGRLVDCWWCDEWAGGATGMVDDDFSHWMYQPSPPSTGGE